MAERVFPDPYQHVRGTSQDPSSEADRQVAQSMGRQPGWRRVATASTTGSRQPRAGGGS